jgi:transcription elongation GreA/GreB family factor
MRPDELLKLAKKEKLDQVEPAWLATIAEGAGDAEALLEVPELLAGRGHVDLAENLLWYLADWLTERGDLQGALQVARRGGRILPGSGVMRELACGLYSQVHSGGTDIEDLIRLTLKAPSLPLDEALAALEKIMALRPGAYVLDRQLGTVGRVAGLDVEKGGIVVTVPEGEKLYGPALVGRLDAVEDDDFRALCAFERDRVIGLAQEDPEELVRIVLTTLDRRMELRRLRLYLEPVVGSWSKWWSSAKGKLKRSSTIGMTEGASPSIFLRVRPLSHEERLLRRFASLEQPMEKMAMALDMLPEAKARGGLQPDTFQQVVDEVAAIGRDAQAAAVRVAAAAVASAVHDEHGLVAVAEVGVADCMRDLLADPFAVVPALTNQNVLLCTLDFIRRRAPHGWQELFVALMPVSGRTVCEALARRLEEAGASDALAEARKEILASTESHPGALSWLWRDCAARQGGLREGADVALGVDPAVVVMQIFSVLAATVRSPSLSEEARKERIAELRSALFMRDDGPLRQALEGARPEQLAAVKDLAERGVGLTTHMQADMTKVLRSIRPALFEKAIPPWDQGIIYTTAEGIARRQEELEHIVHVRLPEVMREVGQAASFGDVSDNAEYSAAVAERARLAERAGRIQEEISEARLITHEMASADHVTIGSRVRARNMGTGETETLTFLGPWDARPEDKVYAYNAPLGLVFMGRRPGETVTYRMDSEERRWEVLEVEPAV